MGAQGCFDLPQHAGARRAAPATDPALLPALQLLLERPQLAAGFGQIRRDPLQLADEQVFVVRHQHGALDAEDDLGGAIGPALLQSGVLQGRNRRCGIANRSGCCVDTSEPTK